MATKGGACRHRSEARGQRGAKAQARGGSNGSGTSAQSSPTGSPRRPGSGAASIEKLRVGVARAAEQIPAGRHLDDQPAIHDRDPVAHRLDDGQVVADEQVSQPPLLPQLGQEVQDLRLDRDVEGRDRLVEHDEAWLGGQGSGDPDALRLPARKLVRVAVEQVGAQPNRRQQGLEPRPARRPLELAADARAVR